MFLNEIFCNTQCEPVHESERGLSTGLDQWETDEGDAATFFLGGPLHAFWNWLT